MALPDSANVCDKSITESHKHEKKEKPPTKVIVRRLPPGITQESFITQVSPLPDYDYIYTVKGDMSLGENAFSRAYINFINVEDVYMFKEKFDNYVFVDNKGHEYAAVVEFASFQKIPKKRGKPRPDPKVGTIESDPTYLEFVESLKQQPNQEEKPEFSFQPGSDSKNDTSTPLLDFLKQRKIDRLKSREEKREERRKREMERKKVREEERKKRFEEKSPVKSFTIKSNAGQSKSDSNLAEKQSEKAEAKGAEKLEKIEEKPEKTPYKGKDRKYEDFRPSNTKPKSKYSARSDKYESFEKKDYKTRRDEYKDKERRSKNFDDYKKDDYKKEDYKKEDYKKDDYRKEEYKRDAEMKQYTKKVKKYSERREERKFEAKKKEIVSVKDDEFKRVPVKEKEDESNKHCKYESFVRSNSEDGKTKGETGKLSERDDREDYKNGDQERDKFKNKENDPRVQRRIRNKDRPTMAIYQPGMLSKRRHTDDDKDSKETTPAKE